MTQRTRRTVLATLSTGLLGGCIDWYDGAGGGGDGTPETTDRTPDTTTTTTGYPGPVTDVAAFDDGVEFDRLDVPYPQRSVGPYYLGLLRTAEEASAFPTERFRVPDPANFLDRTDFERSSVVALCDEGGSSSPNLEFDRAGRSGDTVEFRVFYPGDVDGLRGRPGPVAAGRPPAGEPRLFDDGIRRAGDPRG